MKTAFSNQATTVYRRAGIVMAGLVMLALLSLGMVKGDYQRFLIASIAVNTITVLSISTLAGSSGIWSLGHTAFIALGGYVAANLASVGAPIEIIIPVVVIAAVILGYILGASAGRFSILYFGLLTMAVALTSVEILGRLLRFTGGDQGLSVPPMKSWLLSKPLGPDNAAEVTIILATVILLIADLVVKGAPGRRWRAVKSQRIAATALGLAPYRANANAFAFSAALAAVGGIGLALTLGYLEPLTFQLDSGIMLIVGTVVGGIGSFLGALVGAIFIVGVPEIGRDYPDVAAFFLGTAMILVLLLLPPGLAPSFFSFTRKLFSQKNRSTGARSGHQTAESIARLTSELMPRCSDALSIENLFVSFGGLEVLKDVSLAVDPGQIVGLIGPNGAGKTTIINVLSGFVRPSACNALSFGTNDLRAARSHARLGFGIGRTFQHAELFADLTVRETLTLAASYNKTAVSGPGTATEVVDRLLKELDLESVADSLPEELPFGVQKVIDVARALAAGARLIALDEPFSGLDQTEIRELRAILVGMKAAGVSILIIDHAVQEVLDIADHIVVLNFGRVLATGTGIEISRNVEVQEAYFGKTAMKRQQQELLKHG